MKIINDVRDDIRLKDYDIVVDRLLSDLKRKQDILGMGLFGECSYPGISDLDVIIVTSPGRCKIMLEYLKKWIEDDNIASYLFMHPPLVISGEMFQHAQYLHTMYNIKWFFKKNYLRPETVPPKAHQYIEAIWTSFLLPLAIQIYVSEEVKLRYAIKLLKNLFMSCDNFARYLGNSEKYQKRGLEIQKSLLTGYDKHSFPSEVLQVEIRNALKTICIFLDDFAGGELNHIGKSLVTFKKIIFSGNLLLIQNCFETKMICNQKYSTLFFNEKLMSWLLGFSKEESDEGYIIARRYWMAYDEVASLSCKEKIPMPFISPFGFPFFENNIKAFARDSIFRTLLLARQLRNVIRPYEMQVIP